MLDAALDYAGRGWPVFPLHWPTRTGEQPACSCGKATCENVGKHPIASLVPHGHLEATTDASLIRRWWGKWPHANVGLVTGYVFDALDEDPRAGGDETLRDLTQQLGPLPEGPISITGSGGTHSLLRHAEGVRNSAGAGLDVRGAGGYIVAPPSLHKSGGQYQWAVEYDADTPLPSWPDAWREWLLARRNGHTNGTGPKTLSDLIGKGERNATLASLAGTMRKRGMGEGAILAALTVVNREQCEEPLAEDELSKIAASISRYEPAERRGEPARPQPTVETFRAVDLYHEQLPPVKYAIAGILPEGVTICAGRPKQGKSILVLNLAISVAAGAKALGDLAVEQGDVLYLCLEGGKPLLRSRLHQMLPDSAPPEALTCAVRWPMLTEGGAEAMEDWLSQHPSARLVIVDTLQKVRPPTNGKQGAYEQDYQAMQAIISLAERYHVPFIVVHHTRKSGAEDVFDTISGTTGLTGSVDGNWVLQRVRGQDTAVLAVTGRAVMEQELGLSFDPDLMTWKHAGTGDDAKRSSERKRILAVMEADGGGPLSVQEVADLLDAPDYNAVRQMLWRMERAGELRKEKKGYVIPL